MISGEHGGRTDYRFDYRPGVVRSGPGCVADLGDELDRTGLTRALVVCGRTVGAKRAVMDPIEAGLGDRHGGTFAETTPEKRLATAADGAERATDGSADVLVAVGGGSSLDVAKAISVLASSDRPVETHREALVTTGELDVPDAPLVPIVAVPTTLAGADMSHGAGIAVTGDDGTSRPVSGGVSDSRLMPTALFYDHDLIATTPRDVLAGSAMNGLDKGIESLYAERATPITDATAMRGIDRLAAGLPTLRRDDPADWDLDPVVDGLVLVQYGIARPDARTTSLIHAFGHGLTREYDVQQGVAHAVVAPHALAYVFEHVHGRRNLLADAFGVGAADRTDAETAAAVVDAVADVRDALALPTALGDVEGIDRAGFDAVVDAVLADHGLANGPAGLEPTADEVRAVLERAW